MARVDTLPEILVPLMSAPSIRLERCAVCGRYRPLEQHHMVRRGAGRLYRMGVEVPKPTITLRGFGNNLSDADGRPYCHGLAHANRLHFRWVPGPYPSGRELAYGAGSYDVTLARGGHLEYIVLDEPTKYVDALAMDGWRPLRRWRWCCA